MLAAYVIIINTISAYIWGNHLFDGTIYPWLILTMNLYFIFSCFIISMFPETEEDVKFRKALE